MYNFAIVYAYNTIDMKRNIWKQFTMPKKAFM